MTKKTPSLMTVKLSFTDHVGERRCVDAELTKDHPKGVRDQYILVLSGTDQIIDKTAWRKGDYKIEEGTPTARTLSECAAALDLRKPSLY